MTVDTKDLVTTIAYLIGVKRHIIEQFIACECPETLQKLSEDPDATQIRYLSKLRTALFYRFKKTDEILRYELGKNIDSIEWFDADNIKQLIKWGIPIIQVNSNATSYMQFFSKLISEKIDTCAVLFPEWVKWQYIRDLFCIPKYTKQDAMKKEFDKFMANYNAYPFQMYIHWKPADHGNLLLRDGKFLQIIYEQHNDHFDDYSKFRDAAQETKNNIYDFVAQSTHTAVVVDCENSDPYKLYNALHNLNSDELSKIDKIVLYDDLHTTDAWDMIEKFTNIPVIHIQVERVVDRKSLVDIKMVAGVCKAYYEDNIDSFILVSSDSDYWGLITSLPETKFLVMYEYSKCGKAIQDALSDHGIYYCAIDDFCSGNVEGFKRAVLVHILERYLPTLLYINGKELVEQIYLEARIESTPKEKEAFFSKYLSSIQIRCDSDGTFHFDIKK